MKRRYSLKGLKSFKLVITNGRRFYSKGIRMIVYTQPSQCEGKQNKLTESRFAVVVNRNYGNAVERSKIKRQIRSILLAQLPRMRQGFDIIIFPDATCKTFNYNNLAGSMKQLLLKSRVLRQ